MKGEHVKVCVVVLKVPLLRQESHRSQIAVTVESCIFFFLFLNMRCPHCFFFYSKNQSNLIKFSFQFTSAPKLYTRKEKYKN